MVLKRKSNPTRVRRKTRSDRSPPVIPMRSAWDGRSRRGSHAAARSFVLSVATVLTKGADEGKQSGVTGSFWTHAPCSEDHRFIPVVMCAYLQYRAATAPVNGAFPLKRVGHLTTPLVRTGGRHDSIVCSENDSRPSIPARARNGREARGVLNHNDEQPREGTRLYLSLHHMALPS